MSVRRFVRSVSLPVPPSEAFAWHERPGAFERLAPPWERVTVLERTGGIRDGARVTVRPGFPPLAWRLEHRDYRAGERFRDVQLSGPFARWEHEHRFVPEGEGTRLEDRIDFALPLGPVGALAAPWVERRLDRLFAWRHAVTAHDLAMHARAPRPMTVLVTGAAGFVGSALVPALTTGGHAVRTLTRRTPRAPHEFQWDPVRGTLDPAALEGVDAVVHLAGEGIAERRWTPEHLRAVRESRVRGTRLLAERLAGLAAPPRVLVSASAMGFYGDRGDEVLDESAPAGRGVLPEVAQAWEEAAAPAARAGIRVVHPRIGLVIDPRGGALARMLVPFRLGAGGPLGDGRAWWSWLTLDDLVDVLHRALTDERLAGPVNACTPHPVRNAAFAHALGRALSRPAFLPAPAFALRAVFGGFADEGLLASARMRPARLEALGHAFRHPVVDGALGHLLGRAPHPRPHHGG